MRIAIVGSRDYGDMTRVIDFVRSLDKLDVVVSGGARGVDTVAARTAQLCGLTVVEYPADWSLGRHAGFVRNTQIVENCDRVVAFWDGVSHGTRDTIMRARKAGIPVEVIDDGDP